VDALSYLRGGAGSVTLNCGYGRGSSVLEVIDAVKRVSGVDFKVATAARRPGDPVAIVASSERARARLGWQPRFDDLDTIVRHALAWERLIRERRDAGQA
jgi:UDP-glucose 4-epimerase